ncbi:MAG: DNA-binding protein [Promethearchaeati archaeon SRVP18_Atabeyarchaeia-1]
MAEDEDIEELKEKRLRQLQQQIVDARKQEEARKEFEAQKQSALRQILTEEARSRLMNIKMVKPEFAEQLEMQLIQLAQSGKISAPLTDQQMKEILAKLQSKKRESKISFR